MKLSDKNVLEYQRLYSRRFGREISREKAYEQGIKLLCLMKAIYKPMTREQYNNFQDQGEQMMKVK